MDTKTTRLSPGDIERFSPDPLATFRTNLASVEDRITRACERVRRDRASVRLLPITKTVEECKANKLIEWMPPPDCIVNPS